AEPGRGRRGDAPAGPLRSGGRARARRARCRVAAVLLHARRRVLGAPRAAVRRGANPRHGGARRDRPHDRRRLPAGRAARAGVWHLRLPRRLRPARGDSDQVEGPGADRRAACAEGLAVTVLVDQPERERIRRSLDETLVVEAAAGTGKTSELVARLVNVLAEGRGTVQTIAALTFTEKAAGELKLRLRAGLEEERERAAEGSPRRALLEDAIAHLEEARVSTIHGFCNDLLHERPVEARVDPGFEVLADQEAEALYRRAFDSWLTERLEAPPDGLRRALRRRAFDGDPIERLRKAGWQLAGWRDFREPWQRHVFDREAAIEALVARVQGLQARLTTCARTSDTLYADLWPVRQLSQDVLTRERVAPRDHDGLEAALIDLLRQRTFRSPRRGDARNYRGDVTRDEVLAAHGELLA